MTKEEIIEDVKHLCDRAVSELEMLYNNSHSTSSSYYREMEDKIAERIQQNEKLLEALKSALL